MAVVVVGLLCSAWLGVSRKKKKEKLRERVSGHPNIGLSRQIPGLSELLPVRLVRLGQINL